MNLGARTQEKTDRSVSMRRSHLEVTINLGQNCSIYSFVLTINAFNQLSNITEPLI